ncbi:MAG: hypothetical protein PHF86_10275 [Candidatus Nanoarchaeia archaeon]|nr:hypothetical protein [Candidatus Nanoarchaeia archaeon]
MFKCLICGKPIKDYIPKYCCDGTDCGCYGLPIEPCICSDICEKALFDYIGKTMEERRILANIKKWEESTENNLK